MRFLENTNLLKIEDILPFFPDFVVIDDFKEEICTALEGYSAHIDELKAEMDEATKNAEAIKQDIAALHKRFITVDATEKCSHCALTLMTRQFYVFPCHHTFHADCLIGLVSTAAFTPRSSFPYAAKARELRAPASCVRSSRSQQLHLHRHRRVYFCTPLLCRTACLTSRRSRESCIQY